MVRVRYSGPKSKIMRLLHFLALVVPTSTAGVCGVGSVDLSAVKPFTIDFNCPSNKNDEGIEIGCVKKLKMTAKKKELKQVSNKFFINPCGVYDTKVTECQAVKEKVPESAGFQVTEDVDKEDSKTTTCFSIGSSTKPEFSLLGKHAQILL